MTLTERPDATERDPERVIAKLEEERERLETVLESMSDGIFTVDGLVIMEHNLVYNTKGIDAGSKWGAAGNIDGTRSLLLGCQSLGMVDIGAPDWVEKGFDYDSKQGISTDKFVGFRKPRFDNQYTGNADEDFGVIAVDLHLK